MTETAHHPVLTAGASAVVTGAAGGIGLAAATAFARAGMNVMLVDRHEGEALDAARERAGQGAAGTVLAAACDVSDEAAVTALAHEAREAFGHIDVLMNNAGVGANPGKTWENTEGWRDLIDVNLWGAIHGVQAFAPAMLASGRPGLIVNTGSKQGITLPPGNAAYNVSKAALKAYTEALAHELREAGGTVSAHLLIPGFVWTGMTQRGRDEKPAGAWTAEETVAFMLTSLARGDFYILCPDNDVPRALDERRIAWMAGDLIENRPALSRWSEAWKDRFAAFVARP
jgi:NAD(P)-dependent dehydrogenase (short-subunit alcohol dehydrogenase family)